MAQARGWKLSASQRIEMWSRWKLGQSFHEIGRAFDKDHGVIDFMLSQHGGIAPAVRQRSLRTLTLAERENISRGIASGLSLRERQRSPAGCINGEQRGRPPWRATSVSSSGCRSEAWESALRPKRCLLALHVKLQ